MNFNLDNMYDTLGYVEIAWTNAGQHTDWWGYRVYRMYEGDNDWVLIHQTSNQQGSYFYRDYLAPSLDTPAYVVVEVIEQGGSLSELSYDPQVTYVETSYYWIIHVEGGTAFRLYNVKTDSFKTEYEEEVIHLIGRGRKVDIGDRIGVEGSLSAKLRDRHDGLTGRQQRFTLENTRSHQELLHLRNPFGDVWPVNLSDISFEREAGVGHREFLDVSFEYYEVVGA